jgi:hypothetical protein
MISVEASDRIPLSIGSRHQRLALGTRFVRLVIAGEPFVRRGHRVVHYECRCDCGRTTCVRVDCLKNGNTSSCGCAQAENGATIGRATGKLNRTHGRSKHPLYHVWRGMLRRCYSRKCKSYPSYGGRGITVCDGWRNSLRDFCRWAMSNGWTNGLHLDRIDNDGGYSPENCRFVSVRVNQQNRRDSRIVEINGERRCLAEWARIKGLKYTTVKERIRAYGWDPVAAVLTPVCEMRS